MTSLVLLSVPFFHATGCHSVLVSNLAFGGKIVIMYKWDPERALELIEAIYRSAELKVEG